MVYIERYCGVLIKSKRTQKEELLMINFEYFTPTKVVFGKDTVNEVGRLVKEQGCKKVLVHYGGNTAKASGLLDKVCTSLDMINISYVLLGGVVPNPRLSKVYEGIEICREEGVDFILAVGGGSVIDSAKAIGYGIANDGDVWDFFEGKRSPAGCLAIGTILTISAAGSEMSNSAVITKDEGGVKRGCNTDYSRPKFSIMDPMLTTTLPEHQTGNGIADILMHTMERYFTIEDSMEITDSIAEALMRTVITNGKILMKDPKNYEARAEVMWAGSLSHNGLTGCGSVGDWACHQLEHEISGMFDVAHGAGLAALWGSWARYVFEDKPERFARFAVKVLGVPEVNGDTVSTAMAGIEAMEAFYRVINMPISIKDLGIDVTDEQIKELADNASFAGKRVLGGFKKLNKADMEKIYTMAR